MSKRQGTRDKKQGIRNNKTKESNLKGTMEGLEIWYVTPNPVLISHKRRGQL